MRKQYVVNTIMIAMKKTRSSNALSSISMIASLVLLLSSLLLLSTASAASNLRLLVGSNRHGSNKHGNVASDGILSLHEFQSLLRTSVDDELERIVGNQVNDNNAVQQEKCFDCSPVTNNQEHYKEKSMPSSRPATVLTKTLKKKTSTTNNDNSSRGGGGSSLRSNRTAVVDTTTGATTTTSSSSSKNNNSKKSSSESEYIWESLMEHAWRVADASCSSEVNSEVNLCPFLLCSSSTTQDIKSILLESKHHVVGSSQQQQQESMMIASHPSLNNDNGNCVVMQTTTKWARRFITSNSDNQEYDDIMVQPLLDIMKVHPGTIDIITSSGWKVPFRHTSDNNDYDVQSSATLPLQHNASETIQNWE